MENIIAEEDYAESSISSAIERTSYHEHNTYGSPILPTHDQQQQANEVGQTPMVPLTLEAYQPW